MLIFIIPVTIVIALAIYIDVRNRKIKSAYDGNVHSNAKPGEDQNYLAGDNRYMHGG